MAKAKKPKYVCPITNEQFLKSGALSVTFDGTRIPVTPVPFVNGVGFQERKTILCRLPGTDIDFKVEVTIEGFVVGSGKKKAPKVEAVTEAA